MDKSPGNKNQGQGAAKKPSFKPLDKNAPIKRKGDGENRGEAGLTRTESSSNERKGDGERRKTSDHGSRASSNKGGSYKSSGKGGSHSSSEKSGSHKSSTKDGSHSASDKGGTYKSSGKTGSYEKKEFSKGKASYSGKKDFKTEKSNPELVRLNKHIAASGICSRREADELIKAGLVSVNGKVVTEMGVKIGPGDDIRYIGERMKNERKVYLVLNKPKDYVTTVDDPHASKTVMELIKGACHERVYPVGRLDRGTTGVLLFTNDGDLTKKLTHPSFNKKKIYHVFLNKNITNDDLKKIAEGVELEDGIVRADAIAYSNPDSKREVGIEIHSGKNRVIRRMFEKLDYKVTKLDRVYFAGITKKSITRGKWRFLTEKEVKMLKMNAFE